MSFFQLDAATDANPPKVIVSIAPHRYFVKRIAGDTVDVIVLVPPGASSHTYEPTPKQMISCSKADIWFRLGEGFEKRAAEAFQNFNPKMEMVNLREGGQYDQLRQRTRRPSPRLLLQRLRRHPHLA
jgi:ABC-type Zn uptake system ZnuABC Zn-binding protein ZnuA